MLSVLLMCPAVQPPLVLPLQGEEAVADYLTSTLPAAAAAVFMLEAIVLHLLDSAAFLSGAFLHHLRRRSAGGIHVSGGGGDAGASPAPNSRRPASPVTQPSGSAAERPQAVVAADGAMEVPLDGPPALGPAPEAAAAACRRATPSELREALEAAAKGNRSIMMAVVRRLLGEDSDGAGGAADAAPESAGSPLTVDADCMPVPAAHAPQLAQHVCPGPSFQFLGSPTKAPSAAPFTWVHRRWHTRIRSHMDSSISHVRA